MGSIVKSDGVTQLNGKDYFPFGFFHLSDAARTGDQILADAKLVADAGFNLFLPNVCDRLSFDQWQSIYGMMPVLSNVTPSGKPELFLQYIKTHPNHVGSYIWDDVQHQQDGTPEQAAAAAAYWQALKDKFIKYKTLDPKHITNYSCLMSRLDPTIDDKGKLTDTFLNESYPVGNGDDLLAVHTSMTEAVFTARIYDQSPWAALQTFSWANKPMPSYAQYRVMAYLAICAGVRGIVNYSFWNYDAVTGKGTYVPDFPELWTGLKSMVGEIKRIEPYLLNGVKTTLAVAGRGSMWTLAGKTLLVLVNTQGVGVQFGVTLPQTVVTSVTANNTMTTKGSSVLSGIIPPLGVQVYEF